MAPFRPSLTRDTPELIGPRYGNRRCDVGDVAAGQRVAAWAREHLPAVQMYAHAAGALGQDAIADLTPEVHWAVCRAKVVGASLGAALGCVESQHLFSSTAAVWSQPGAAHYSGANAYLDVHAAGHRFDGLPTFLPQTIAP